MLKAIFFNVLFIFSLSAVAYAKGEGTAENLNKEKPKSFSLDNKQGTQLHSFSLRSGIYFKGENLINTEASNTAAFLNNLSFEKSKNNSYLNPYKKKVILNKITFNPNELLRNYPGK